jgi:hypothetical protein
MEWHATTREMSEVQPNMAHVKRPKFVGCKDNVPSVHGRPNNNLTNKIRLSNHQRNLSLDFRSVVESPRVCIFFLIMQIFNWGDLAPRAVFSCSVVILMWGECNRDKALRLINSFPSCCSKPSWCRGSGRLLIALTQISHYWRILSTWIIVAAWLLDYVRVVPERKIDGCFKQKQNRLVFSDKRFMICANRSRKRPK